MKVLHAFGYCRFEVACIDGVTRTVDLKINNNMFQEDIEVGFYYLNIYGMTKKSTSGIKRKFTIDIIKKDTDQTDLLKLLWMLKNGVQETFYFYPHFPNNNYNEYFRYLCIFKTLSISNIGDNAILSGQKISMTVECVELLLMTDIRVKYIPYRLSGYGETSSTAGFGIYPLSSKIIPIPIGQNNLIGIINT
jgi:hypothetical protein